MVRTASLPITARPTTINSAPAIRRGGSGSLHEAGEDEAAERRARGLDHTAVAERNEHIADIGQEREREPAEQRQHSRAPPAQTAEIAEPVGGDDRQQR
jgi:hypothetical protein